MVERVVRAAPLRSTAAHDLKADVTVGNTPFEARESRRRGGGRSPTTWTIRALAGLEDRADGTAGAAQNQMPRSKEHNRCEL